VRFVSDWLRRSVTDPTEAELDRRLFSVFVVVIGFGLALVWLNLMVQATGYRTENAARLIEKLDHEHAELVSAMTRETTPDRLRRQAEQRLGLRAAGPGQVITFHAEP
jgi:hypothetical protein